MKSQASPVTARIARPKITRLMVLCGIVGALAAGAVGASTAEDDVPRVIVKYEAQALDTDAGARVLYHRLTIAAEKVCPDSPGGSLMGKAIIQQCRAQALARAVQKINNPRLAALDGMHEKHS